MSRWNGLALVPAAMREATGAIHAVQVDVSGLIHGRYASPNKAHEAREGPTVSGWMDLSGDLARLGPLLRLGERSHLGRHAVEGLGGFVLEPPQTDDTTASG